MTLSLAVAASLTQGALHAPRKDDITMVVGRIH